MRTQKNVIFSVAGLFLWVLISVCLNGCGKREPDTVSLEVERMIALFSPDETTDAKFFLAPGGNMTALSNPDFIEVSIKNSGSVNIDLSAVTTEAYLYGGKSDILLIRLIKSGRLSPRASATYLVNTDGYSEFLHMSVDKGSSVTLCILLWHRDKLVSSASCQLPSYPEIEERERIPLTFASAPSVPDVAHLTPRKIDEWPNYGPGFGPPVVAWQEGDDWAVYLYFPRRGAAIATVKLADLVYRGGLRSDLTKTDSPNATLRVLERRQVEDR